MWWNYFTYSSIGIRLSSTMNSVRVIRFQPVEGAVVERELRSKLSNVCLTIECGDRYRFGFHENSEQSGSPGIDWLGEVSNRVMTQAPPVGAPFTGMMFGLYAFGKRQPCLVPADFEFAECK